MGDRCLCEWIVIWKRTYIVGAVLLYNTFYGGPCNFHSRLIKLYHVLLFFVTTVFIVITGCCFLLLLSYSNHCFFVFFCYHCFMVTTVLL